MLHSPSAIDPPEVCVAPAYPKYFFAIVGFGSKQAFDVERFDGDARHGEGLYVRLQAVEGFAVGGEQQIDLVGATPSAVPLTLRYSDAKGANGAAALRQTTLLLTP